MEPKAHANETVIKLMNFFISMESCLISYETMIFQYGLEPVPIQRILIGFGVILEKFSHSDLFETINYPVD